MLLEKIFIIYLDIDNFIFKNEKQKVKILSHSPIIGDSIFLSFYFLSFSLGMNGPSIPKIFSFLVYNI